MQRRGCGGAGAQSSPADGARWRPGPGRRAGGRGLSSGRRQAGPGGGARATRAGGSAKSSPRAALRTASWRSLPAAAAGCRRPRPQPGARAVAPAGRAQLRGTEALLRLWPRALPPWCATRANGSCARSPYLRRRPGADRLRADSAPTRAATAIMTANRRQSSPAPRPPAVTCRPNRQRNKLRNNSKLSAVIDSIPKMRYIRTSCAASAGRLADGVRLPCAKPNEPEEAAGVNGTTHLGDPIALPPRRPGRAGHGFPRSHGPAKPLVNGDRLKVGQRDPRRRRGRRGAAPRGRAGGRVRLDACGSRTNPSSRPKSMS
jgi:hypothetical protein